MIGGDRPAPRWKIGRKVSQGEVYGSPRGCKTTTPIREEKEGMRLLNILGADCRVCRFLFYLRFASAFLLYIVEILRDISIPRLLFARDVARILRINERSLLSRREERFFCIFSFFLSLSLILLEDTAIGRLLFSFRWNSLFLLYRYLYFIYILSQVKSCLRCDSSIYRV